MGVLGEEVDGSWVFVNVCVPLTYQECVSCVESASSY